MKAQARFTFEKVNFEQDKDVHLVVGLSAPKLEAGSTRPSICIIPVIDISGSMQGPKLDYAKKSVMKLIDHLQPGDYCGLVVFESHVQTISKPVEMTQVRKDELKVKVGELHTMGGTNFSGGMLEALGLIADMDLPNGVLNRVIMFTDGCANEGIARDQKSIVALLKANMGRATVSAFGYGGDADRELLAEVSKTGDGNFAFIKNPDDALSAFAKELGGLLSTHAQNIRVSVAPHGEHKVTEVVSDVDSEEKDGKVFVKIPDLLAEETRNIVISMRIAKQPKAFPRATSVVDVQISYETIGEDKKKEHHTEELKGKLEFVKPGEEDTQPIKEVMELAGTAILVQQQILAEEQAKRGDYISAGRIMRSCGVVLNDAGLNEHANVAAYVTNAVSTPQEYKTSGGVLGGLISGGTSALHVSSYDPQAESLLRSMKISTSNSAQDAAVSSFKDESGGVISGEDPNVGAIGGTGINGLGAIGIANVAAVDKINWTSNVILDPALVGGMVAPVTGANAAVVINAPEPKKSGKSVSKKHSKRW